MNRFFERSPPGHGQKDAQRRRHARHNHTGGKEQGQGPRHTLQDLRSSDAQFGLIIMTVPPDFTPSSTLVAWLTGIRRHLHHHPELAYQEKHSAAFIVEKLNELGVACRTGVAGTGVVATLANSGRAAPCVALRADMDALPVQEDTGLPFASAVPGVMHACGHDGHVAMLLGAAALLKSKETELPGRVVLLFQPAEEAGGGAKTMIAEGALTGVRMIFGGHIEPYLAVGEIGVQSGPICAFTDGFSIEVEGSGGHGAKPHQTVDAIVAASHLVVAVQTLVSREVDPVRPAVLTIGKFQGGTAGNVIAERVSLAGTIRSIEPEIRKRLMDGLARMCRQVGELFRARIDLTFRPGYIPIINEPAATELARRAALATVGASGVISLPYPSMGGEDFSFYQELVPGCFVRFGARNKEGTETPLHSPRFDFAEEVLPLGAEFLARAAWLGLQGTDE